MNVLIIGILLSTVAISSASVIPSTGAVVSGPSGIVTNHGALGLADDIAVVGHEVIGQGVIVPDVVGHGVIGHGVGHSGVLVQGPQAVPAVIAGPSGKIVADNAWGPTSHYSHGVHGW